MPTIRTIFPLLAVFSVPAAAWEPTTHAGVTQEAATASALHRVLLANGRPLGMFDSLRLTPPAEPGKNSADEDDLLRRLALLDREGGYGSDERRLTAIGWLVAGAVVEDAPIERQRHHYYAPPRGELEHDTFAARVARWHDGIDSLRGFIAGGSGHFLSAPEWLLADRTVNAWGLARYLDERERATAAPTLNERNDAWARALLAAGAVVHLVEDAGDPAHARGDLAPPPTGAPSLARWVAGKFGRLGVPPAAPEAPVPSSWTGFWHDPSGGGASLGDYAAALYSPGTLPTPDQDLAPPPARGYITGRVPHLLAYQRRASGVDYVLDELCLADYARQLLPATVAMARVALDRLFRGDVELALDGDQVTAKVLTLPWGKGTVRLFIDDAKGQRHLLTSSALSGSDVGTTVLRVPVPSDGEVRVAVLFRGVDANGEALVVSREQLLVRGTN